MLEDYYAEIRSQLDRLVREVPRPNILTLGMTGAGKSSLINHIFGNAVAVTGTGKPVTQGITFYDSPARGIGIFDSRGYEFGRTGEEAYYQETVAFAANTTMGGINRGVHLAWYCIPAESERIQPIDERTISYFCKIGVPTAVVITKSDHLSLVNLSRFAKLIKEKTGQSIPLFKTTILRPGDDAEIQKLCSWSSAALPESLRLAFTRAQRLLLDSKKEQAVATVRTFQANTSSQGFAFFNSADEQAFSEKVMQMAAIILYIYEMEEIRDSFSNVGSLIDQGDRMVEFVAILVEKAAEMIGYLIAESHGREVGRLIGHVLSNFSRSITSQKLIEAIGLSIVGICADLADQAIAIRGAVSLVVPAQIEHRFVTDVRRRMES